jgi:hypothetical protein
MERAMSTPDDIAAARSGGEGSTRPAVPWPRPGRRSVMRPGDAADRPGGAVSARDSQRAGLA